MHLIFEDAGKLHFGKVLSEAEASAQVELPTGKRLKVKATHQLLRVAPAQADAVWQNAQTLAGDIDLDLAWEFAPEDEFGFQDVARDYFQDPPTPEQQAAALLGLHQAPHYFRRLGKGRFKKASAEVVQQALQAIARKKEQQAQVQAWADELVQGQCPQAIRDELFRILFKPDKNALVYQAVALATQRQQLPVLEVLKQAGAIDSAYAFHWQRFLFEHFPKGTRFPQLDLPAAPQDLPLADTVAYSIDDSHTTEIDDALSVQGLDQPIWTVGIHIAAPGSAISPNSAWDELARSRLSTVYMPGHKVTMFPDTLVQQFSLDAGTPVPALSLYVQVDAKTLDILGSETRLERITIGANLRHDQLDDQVTESWLQNAAPADTHGLPHAELRALHQLAQKLKKDRELVRGKPENFNRPDPVFRLDNVPPEGPTGQETVTIGERRRGAPLDLIVAEAMILANRTWGQWMADLGVPAIYRSQASLAPGIKVRMGTKALPHAGMGVSCYAWSTSPLRRYTDLVNQWQILACLKHGNTAALAAPFQPKDTALLAIISAFDAAYSAYNAHQSLMERYWSLTYLRQSGITELEAQVIKDLPGTPPVVRVVGLPLVFPLLGAPALQRGQRVSLRITHCDDLSLEVTAEFLAMARETPGPEADAEVDADADSEDDNLPAAGLGLALDLQEDTPPAA